MNIATLKQRIAETERALTEARTLHEKAVGMSATRRDADSRARVAFERNEVENLESELQHLNGLLDDAMKVAKSPEGKAQERKRKALVEAFEHSKVAECAAAKIICQAAEAHLEAVRRYVKQRQESERIATEYLTASGLEIGDLTRIGEKLLSTPNSVLLAYARPVKRLVEAIEHDGMSAFIPLNHYVFSGGIAGPSTMYDALMSASAAACEAIEHTEQVLSPDYAPAAPQPVKPFAANYDVGHYIAKDWQDLMQFIAKGFDIPAATEQGQTHTIAKNWPEYLAATSHLESPEVLHEE